MYLMQSQVQLIRIVATTEPVLSDQSIALRVRAAISADGVNPFDRPLAAVYLRSHSARVRAGHDQAILCVMPSCSRCSGTLADGIIRTM